MAKRAYIGVAVTSKALSEYAEGDIVRINENGSPVEFYVAKHDYESGLNGAGRTLLVRKYGYDQRRWHSSNANNFAQSEICSWLNNDYVALLDSNVRSLIATTKFYYTVGCTNNQSDPTITTLEKSIFLLSMTELGLSHTRFNVEGSVLPIATILLIAKNSDGNVIYQWTRTPMNDASNMVFSVNQSGSVNSSYPSNSSGEYSRPCFTLPSTIGVFDGLITGEESTVKKSVARKIKKGYVGINGIAHKIKKAYIGIGGVARPCWSGGELAYYGTITELTEARYGLAATTVGNYALFGGGDQKSSNAQSIVDVYNKSLTKGSVIHLYDSVWELAATTVGNYAMFGGGRSSSGSYTDITTAFDTSLTKKKPSVLSTSARLLSATSVGGYALFGGGSNSIGKLSAVNAYDVALSKISVSNLGTLRDDLAATTVGDYALFGGGISSLWIGDVDVYDSSLTKTTATSLGIGRSSLSATTVGDYALFLGGSTGSYAKDRTNYVDAYNTSLTRTTPALLSVKRNWGSAVTLDGHAIMYGGTNANNSYCNAVDVYDASLVRTVMEVSISNKSSHAGTAVGDYALFGGGYTTKVVNNTSATRIVEAFTIA